MLFFFQSLKQWKENNLRTSSVGKTVEREQRRKGIVG
jgi:hypothetical protein